MGVKVEKSLWLILGCLQVFIYLCAEQSLFIDVINL